MKIIGLAGTNGSGKDTIGDLLAEKHGFLFISGSDLLRDEARKRGLPVERENLRMISAEWRRKSGLGALIDQAIELYQKDSSGQTGGMVIASLRNPGEADRVHELGGTVIWVDADPKVRYDRVFSRQRTDEDNKTFEEFLSEEQTEMTHSGDAATLNMGAVKELADITLLNNGNNIKAFRDEAEKVLRDIIQA